MVNFKLWQWAEVLSGREYNFDLSTPFCDLSPEVQDIIIHGTNGHEVKVYYKGKR